jgi:uncharacterized protein YdeI (YjbR/CyaY-like superfamily)
VGKRDPRVDAYIEEAAPFAQPILKRLREVVHAACPTIEETMKWSFPHFMYKKGILCSMAAFQQHATFGFWKGSLIVPGKTAAAKEAMGQFGRLTKVSELPSKTVLAGYVQQAMKLDDAGVKSPARAKPRGAAKPVAVPAVLSAALKKNKKALATFEAFAPSHKKEYIEWITEAKSEDTRQRRLANAIEWMAAGKKRHWKYENC